MAIPSPAHHADARCSANFGHEREVEVAAVILIALLGSAIWMGSHHRRAGAGQKADKNR